MKMKRFFIFSVLMWSAALSQCSGFAADDSISAVHSSGGSAFSNASVSNEYWQLSERLCAELEKNFASSHVYAVPIIKTVGYLRIIQAKPFLLEKLGYPLLRPGLAPNAIFGPNDDYKLFLGWFVIGGETRSQEGAFPAVGAVKRIGVTFPEVTNSLPKYPQGGVRNRVFAQLGRQSAGYYFEKYIDTLIASGDVSSKKLLDEMVNHRPAKERWMFLDAKHGYTNYNIQVCNRYDAMQDELIARFKSQLASGDAEIADTIYTMGFIRSDRAMPLLIDNLTVCPQVSTNAPAGFVFPAAEALISIAPPLGICFEKLDSAAPMSPEESLWLRVTHEVYPEAIEYELFRAAATNDMRAVRLMKALPWRRLTEAEMSDSRSVGARADQP